MVRSRMRRRIGLEGPAPDENGFTLIELVITVVVLPIVIGGITLALLSVFGLQNGVQNRIGNSNDQLVSASTFNKDVQSAQQIETVTSPPACGAAVAGQTQLVGLQWGQDSTGAYQTVVSYVVVPTQATVAPYKATNSLVRNLCTSGTVHDADEHQSGLPRHRGSGDELPDDTESSVHRDLQPERVHRSQYYVDVDAGALRRVAQYRRPRQ